MRRNTDLQMGFLRRLLDRLLDLIVARALLEAGDEVDNGYIARGYTEGHTGELTVQAGDDIADGLGRTSGRPNNVGSGAAPSVPVLCGGTVDGLLGGGRSVHGRHQTLDDAGPSLMTLARGTRQFVVHEALETMTMSEVYSSSLTPNTNMGASAEGRDDDFLRADLEVRCGRFW